MKQAFSLIALALLVGCSAVYSPVPVGDQPVDLQGSEEEWEGTWLTEEGFVSIMVSDAANGVLKVAWHEEDEGELKSMTWDVYLRTGGGWMFASAIDPDEPDYYIWGRIAKAERSVVVWGPEVAKFEALVEEGTLPGTVDGDVFLGELQASHLSLIASETRGVLFDWEAPQALFRWW